MKNRGKVVKNANYYYFCKWLEETLSKTLWKKKKRYACICSA